jgi:uncharacterized protein YbjT (DUF2867 family)
MLIDAAKAAGVKRFVYVSMQGVTLNHAVDFIRNKAKAEAYLQASGLGYVILRPPAFMEWHVHNLLGKSILDAGKVTIFGSGNNPTNFMAGKDIAHITDPKLGGRIIEMGGPDNITKNQVAEMYGRFSGSTPKVSHVPPVVMRIMAPIVKPLNPVISRLMTASVWGDTTDQTFDPAAMLKEFPMRLTHVDEFIRERVKN